MTKIVKSFMAVALVVALGVSVTACGKGGDGASAVGDHAGGNSEQPAK